MEVDVANFLMSQFAVVLQDVVVLEALGLLQGRGNVLLSGHKVRVRSCLAGLETNLGYRKELCERVVRDICEFLAVVLWDDELESVS